MNSYQKLVYVDSHAVKYKESNVIHLMKTLDAEVEGIRIDPPHIFHSDKMG